MDEKKMIASTFLRDTLHVLFKRKTQILVFLLVTVFAVAIGSLLVKPTYEATAQILLKTGREDVYVPTVIGNTSSTPFMQLVDEQRINSEIQILDSLYLAEKVVESLGPTVIYPDLQNTNDQTLLERLQAGLLRLKASLHALVRGQQAGGGGEGSLIEQAALRLQQDLKVDAVKKSNVITVTFDHQKPDMAALVLNTLVKEYLVRHLDVYKNPQSYEFFAQQTQDAKDKLQQTQAAMLTFKKEHDLSSLNDQRLILLKNAGDARAALDQTLSDQAATRDRLQQLRAQLATTPTSIPLDVERDKNAFAISNLQARLVDLQIKERDLTTKYTDQNRLVRDVRAQIQMTEKALAEAENKDYEKVRTGVNTVRQALDQEVFKNNAELQALTAKAESQKAQLAQYQNGLQKLNADEATYTRMQQELDAYQQNYHLYLTKAEESRISSAMDKEKMSSVSLIEPAQPPIDPASPKLLLNMVLAVFLGALGAVGLAFSSEYLDGRLEKAEDVERHLRLPVLASIPEAKS